MLGNIWNSGGLRRLGELLLFGGAMLTVMAATQYYSAVSAEQPEMTGPPIPYDHLANQETDPFLFLGYIMDSEMARWPQYRRAVGRFPDVRACLVKEEQEKDKPNLLLIDWDQTGMGKGAEVCVFLIARSLGSVERIRKWLEFHEFKLGTFSRTRSTAYRETQPVSNMSAYWTVEQYRKHNPSLIRTLTGFDLALRYEIVLQFSEINQIVGVRVVIPSK